MAEIKWIKITTSIFDDEAIKVIEQMPEGDAILVIWFKLLVQAGIINDSGLVYFKKDIPYTEDMLAVVFHKPVTLIRLALTTFEKFGMIEISDNRTILIRNWEKHQNIETLDIIREQTRKRVKKYREKQKLLLSNSNCNVTPALHVTQCNAVEEDKEEDIEEEYIKQHYTVKNFYSKNNFENIPLNEMDAEAYKIEAENWRGTYNNVHLTEEQYKKLQALILSKEKTDEIINEFSENIAAKGEKAKPYDEAFPDMHFIICKKYWEFKRKYPAKFNPALNRKANKEDIARENMRLVEKWLENNNEEEE